jgi:hypothetical protein
MEEIAGRGAEPPGKSSQPGNCSVSLLKRSSPRFIPIRHKTFPNISTGRLIDRRRGHVDGSGLLDFHHPWNIS